MSWNKKGLIIEPDKNLWWNQSHGMLPTVQHLEGDKYKVFYSGRDKDNVSHIGYSIIEVKDDVITEISKSDEPIMSPGERGCFDDNGITPSSIQSQKMYYIGWNSGTTTTRMSLIMGLAKETVGSYERVSRAPLMPKTNKEPFGICTAPFVIKDGNLYKMWYVYGNGWINKDLPKYDIKYATSKDGYTWKRDGTVSLALEENETALARPCAFRSSDIFEMYFSYKDPALGYRIGYATSLDGVKFKRSNNFSEYLDVSNEGWDSEMVEYSFVFDHQGKRFMLYNGNGYGKSGIGYAVKQ